MPLTEEKKSIGQIIAEARKQSGLSLRAVAGRVPINFSYLADIEKLWGDGVCRPVFFPSFEGSAFWYDAAGRLKVQSEFADLSKDKAAELLRALLDPDSGWMKTVLR